MPPHAPAPLQSPVTHAPSVHSESGSVSAMIDAHVPSLPPVFAALHASQVPEQSVSQQTPSTQKLLLHWYEIWQAWPTPSPQVSPSNCEHESVASLQSVQYSDCSARGQVLPLP